MTLLVFSLLTLSAQPVEVDIPPVTASVAAERLTSAFGVRLHVSPELEREIVTVRCSSSDREETMQALADVFSAAWTERPDGSFLLSRSAQESRRLAEAEHEELRKSLQEALRKLEAQTPPQSSQAQAEAVIRSFQEFVKRRRDGEGLPAPRDTNVEDLLRRLVLDLGADRLASDLPPRRSAAFGHPRLGLQLPLPAGSDEIIRRFAQTEELLADMVAAEWAADNQVRYVTENVFRPALRRQPVGAVSVFGTLLPTAGTCLATSTCFWEN